MSRDPWGTSDPRDPFLDTLYKHGYKPIQWKRKFAILPVRTTTGKWRWFTPYYAQFKITVAFNGGNKKVETFKTCTPKEYLLELLKSKPQRP